MRPSYNGGWKSGVMFSYGVERQTVAQEQADNTTNIDINAEQNNLIWSASSAEYQLNLKDKNYDYLVLRKA